MTRERYALIVISLAMMGIGTLRISGVTGNLTDSEPTGLYVRMPASTARGGMVELRPLMKSVAGVPGDTVHVTPEGSYINGKLWPYSAIPSDIHLRPYPFGTYTLAPGQYWLLGLNPHSWDSRFLGPIPDDMIRFPIKPLWTASNGFAPGTRPWDDAARAQSWVEEHSERFHHDRARIDPRFTPPPLTNPTNH